MNILKKLLLSLLFIFLISTPAFADVVWPSMYIAEGMHSLKVIVLGLVAELLFVKFFTNTNWLKACTVTVLMNLVSSFIGYIPILFLGMFSELLPFRTFHWTHWLFAYLIAIVINTIIESIIIKLILKLKFKNIILWLFIANTISVLICILFYGLQLGVKL